MSRYIDADKLQEEFKELHCGKRSLLIDTQPTADVVEVVRCQECKHFDTGYCGIPFIGKKVNPNHYCSYGERAEQ